MEEAGLIAIDLETNGIRAWSMKISRSSATPVSRFISITPFVVPVSDLCFVQIHNDNALSARNVEAEISFESRRGGLTTCSAGGIFTILERN